MTRASKLIWFCVAVLVVVGGLTLTNASRPQLEIPERPLPGPKKTGYPDDLFIGEARKFVRALLDSNKSELFAIAMGAARTKLDAERREAITVESRALVLTALDTAAVSRPDPSKVLVSFDKKDGTECEVYLATIPRNPDNKWGIVVTDFTDCEE